MRPLKFLRDNISETVQDKMEASPGRWKSFREAYGDRWTRDAEGVDGVGNGEGYPAPQTTRGLGEHRKPPPSGVQSRAPAKTIFCFLSVSERLSASRCNVCWKLTLFTANRWLRKMGLLNGCCAWWIFFNYSTISRSLSTNSHVAANPRKVIHVLDYGTSFCGIQTDCLWQTICILERQ